jgi:hypothetical protein
MKPLLKTKRALEDIYYKYLLNPRLRDVMCEEASAYAKCIMYILWIMGRKIDRGEW